MGGVLLYATREKESSTPYQLIGKVKTVRTSLASTNGLNVNPTRLQGMSDQEAELKRDGEESPGPPSPPVGNIFHPEKAYRSRIDRS